MEYLQCRKISQTNIFLVEVTDFNVVAMNNYTLHRLRYNAREKCSYAMLGAERDIHSHRLLAIYIHRFTD